MSANDHGIQADRLQKGFSSELLTLAVTLFCVHTSPGLLAAASLPPALAAPLPLPDAMCRGLHGNNASLAFGIHRHQALAPPSLIPVGLHNTDRPYQMSSFLFFKTKTKSWLGFSCEETLQKGFPEIQALGLWSLWE